MQKVSQNIQTLSLRNLNYCLGTPSGHFHIGSVNVTIGKRRLAVSWLTVQYPVSIYSYFSLLKTNIKIKLYAYKTTHILLQNLYQTVKTKNNVKYAGRNSITLTVK